MADRTEITVADVARHVGGTLEGDGEQIVTTFAPLDAAGPDAVSWVGDAEYAGKAATSNAAAVLVTHDTPPVEGKTLIRVADPDDAMIATLSMLAPPADFVPPGVHPTAVLGDGAVVDGAAVGPHVVVGARSKIGRGTQLHAGVCIGSDVSIGEASTLHANVVVRERITIGNRVVIHANSTIGSDGFSYIFRDGAHKKVPQIGTVVIADDVEIGSNVAIDRARSGATRIGVGTKIDNLVQVGHNVQIGAHCIIISFCGLAGSCELEDYCVIAGRASVIDHRKLGKAVRVAAHSLVTNDVPDGTTVRGAPAVEIQASHRAGAAARKLPDALRTIRELKQRVEALERGLAHPDEGA